MRCATCGENLREGAKFCPTCGTPTAAASQARPAQSQAQPAAPAQPSISTSPPQQESPVGQMSGARREQQAPPPPPRDPGQGYSATGLGSSSGAPGQRPRAAAGSASAIGTPTSQDFNTLMERLTRLLRLDTSVFGEVYRDTNATIPVAVFAAVVLLISGLGGMIYIAQSVGFDIYELGGHSAVEFLLFSAILGTVFALAALAAWAGVTMFAVNQFGAARADFLGLARVLGLAIAPLVLTILLFLDELWYFAGLGWLIFGAVVSLAVIGVLEAVEVRPGQGWAATLLGFLAFTVILVFLGADTRDLAPGFYGIIF